MRKYIIFANLALVIVVIFLGMKSYGRMKELSREKKINIPIKQGNREYAKVPKKLRPSSMAGSRHPGSYYDVIPKNNLFRPERKEYEEPLSNEKKKAPMDNKDIRPPAVDLYGIMIDNNKKVALIYDQREKVQNLRYKVVSIGSEIQGYEVIRIQAEHIIVEKDGRRATIKLSQAKVARGGMMTPSKKVPKIVKKTKTTEKGVTTPGKVKKLVPDNIPPRAPAFEIKKEGGFTYKIIKTPVGERKIRIN